MDLIKIGKFIAEKRKARNLTQAQLADSLCVTDRAISKWECGRCLPDSSIMLDLCKVLEISVNELLTGEDLKMENYNNQAELNLLEAIKQKEESDKRLLRIEIGLGIIGLTISLSLFIVGLFGNKYWGLESWAMIVMIVLSAVIFFSVVLVALRIEQKAGYYECKECGHKYIPTFWQVLFAPHVNRTRYMKCPHCGKRSYQRKVISKK